MDGAFFLERAMKTGNLVPIALPSAFVRPPALWINPLFYLVYRCDLADLRVGPSFSFSRSSFLRCQLNRPKRVNKGRTGWMVACSLAREARFGQVSFLEQLFVPVVKRLFFIHLVFLRPWILGQKEREQRDGSYGMTLRGERYLFPSLHTFVGRSLMLFTPEITSFLKIGYFRSANSVLVLAVPSPSGRDN